MRTPSIIVPIAAGIVLAGAVGALALVLNDSAETLGALHEATAPTESAEVPDAMQVDAERSKRVAVDDWEGEGASTVDSRKLELPDRTAEVVVRGRVVDGVGAPVVGALVEVRSRGSFSVLAARARAAGTPDFFRGRGRPPRGARDMLRSRQFAEDPVTTDAQGMFELAGKTFADASFELRVNHDSFATATVRREWKAADGALDVEDIVLEAGGTIRGRVVQAGDIGVAGAQIRFVRGRGRSPGARFDRGARWWGRPDGDDRDDAELVTDGSGFFELRHVPKGNGTVEVVADRYEVKRSRSVGVENNEVVEVGSIVLDPAVTVRGVVVDSMGQPVAGAEVEVSGSREEASRDEGGGRRGRSRNRISARSATTDEEGRFQVDHVSMREPLRVEVDHERYLGEVVDPVPAGVPFTELTITMLPRMRAEGIVVDAKTGAVIENYGISVRESRAAMMDERMQRFARFAPQAGADGQNRANEFFQRLERQQSVLKSRLGGSGEVPGRVSDPEFHAEGRFSFEDLEEGTFVFDVRAPGYVAVAAGPVEVVRGAQLAPITVRLQRGVEFGGRVVDAGSREPIAGARVEVRIPQLTNDDGDNGNPFGRMTRRFRSSAMTLGRTETDANGEFVFEPQMPGGVVVVVRKRGYSDVEIEGTVLSHGSNTDLDIQLTRGARVFGRVLGLEEGRRARVVFDRAEGFGRAAANVAEDGTYEIDLIEAGPWFVRVEERARGSRGLRGRGSGGGASLVRRLSDAEPDLVVPEHGGDVQFDVRADVGTSTGRIDGQVVVVGGGDVRGLRVQVQPISGAVADAARSFGADRARRGIANLLGTSVDADGSFSLPEVPPGMWRVEVSRGVRSGVLASQEMQVTAGARLTTQFAVAFATLEVELRSNSGELPSSAQMTLVPAADVGEEPPAQWRQLSSDRTVRRLTGERTEVRQLPIGDYRFSVRARGFALAEGRVTLTGGKVFVSVDLEPADTGK